MRKRNSATWEKTKQNKMTLSLGRTCICISSQTRQEWECWPRMPAGARRGHLAVPLLQIMPFPNYSTKIPPSPIFKACRKRSSIPFPGQLFCYFTTLTRRKFLLTANPSQNTWCPLLLLSVSCSEVLSSGIGGLGNSTCLSNPFPALVLHVPLPPPWQLLIPNYALAFSSGVQKYI